jgi:hypothetical protein
MKINILLGLGFIFLASSVFATDAHDEKHAHPPTFDKWAPQPPPPPLEIDPVLKTAVEDYTKAWQKRDFDTMYGHEDWQGGATLKKDQYEQAFDADLKIHNWKVTRVLPMPDQKDTFIVLVLITHNPSKQVAAFVPPGLTVRSTLRQWWQKKEGKFVHLFNIEREELAKMGMPPEVKDALATPKTAK